MDEEEFGPKMSLLTPKQRQFVMAYLSNPWGNAVDWARAAGYSDSSEAAKVSAHRLLHDPRVMTAAREYAAAHHLDQRGVTMAISVLVNELGNSDPKIRLAAANSILDRGGVSAKTEHKVTVEHSAGDMERIALRLAGELGIAPMKLIGGNTVTKNITENIPVIDPEIDKAIRREVELDGKLLPPMPERLKEHGDIAERVNQDKMDIDNDIAW
jgi:hypothetical protein